MFSLGMFLFSCDDDDNNGDDDDDNHNDTTFTLSQDILNGSINEVKIGLIGPFTTAADSVISIGHPGDDADSTFRDVYSNMADASLAAQPGDLITKRTYAMNGDGSRGALKATFAMFKRESGYNTVSGDWEYVVMPFDSTNDYTLNPNGLLPAEDVTSLRGKIGSCMDCHSTDGNNDYRFVFPD